jgi:hypothetical protein
VGSSRRRRILNPIFIYRSLEGHHRGRGLDDPLRPPARDGNTSGPRSSRLSFSSSGSPTALLMPMCKSAYSFFEIKNLKSTIYKMLSRDIGFFISYDCPIVWYHNPPSLL